MTVQKEKKCMACGTTKEVQGHHILYDPELVIPLCKSHHLLAETQGKTYHSLKARHEIGKALLNQLRTGKVFNVQRFVEENAKKKRVSVSEIYAYIRFAEKFPDIGAFLTSYPNARWHFVVRKLLYGQAAKTNTN
jgi:hypothetical protein